MGTLRRWLVLGMLLGIIGLMWQPGAAAQATAPAPFGSGGLGLSRQEWEHRHGKPYPIVIGIQYAYECYGDCNQPGTIAKFIVSYMDNIVWILQFQYPNPVEVSISQARADSHALMPADAHFLRTATTDQGDPYDIYSSAGLLARYGPSNAGLWGSGTPGTFTVEYDMGDTNTFTGMTLGMGDQP